MNRHAAWINSLEGKQCRRVCVSVVSRPAPQSWPSEVLRQDSVLNQGLSLEGDCVALVQEPRWHPLYWKLCPCAAYLRTWLRCKARSTSRNEESVCLATPATNRSWRTSQDLPANCALSSWSRILLAMAWYSE